MAAGPADLTTVPAVRQYLSLPSSTDEAEIQRMITAVSSFVVEVIDRPVLAQDVSLTASGKGNAVQYLPYWPVIEVKSVKIDGAPVDPATPGGSDVGWLLDPLNNHLVLRGTTFTRGVMNIEIVYRAGYEAGSVPLGFEQATLEIIADRYRRKSWVGLQSRGGPGGESLSFSQEDIPPQAKLFLDHVRRVVPA